MSSISEVSYIWDSLRAKIMDHNIWSISHASSLNCQWISDQIEHHRIAQIIKIVQILKLKKYS